MTDEAFDPGGFESGDAIGELQSFAAERGIELDLSDYESVPEFGDEAFAMPDDDGYDYADGLEDYEDWAQQVDAYGTEDARLDDNYADLQHHLGRELTHREWAAMEQEMHAQAARGEDGDPAEAYWRAMQRAGENPVVLDENASVHDMTRWAQEAFRDRTSGDQAELTQEEVDHVAEQADGDGPQAHAARVKLAQWQMQGLVGLRGEQ